MTWFAKKARASCGISLFFAIAAAPVHAHDPLCAAPVRIDSKTSGGEPQALRAYRPVLQQCRNARNQTRLAIRRMGDGAASLVLTVDPNTLATALEHDRCWICADTTQDAQKNTRYMRAVMKPTPTQGDSAAPFTPVLRNAGVTHGAGAGSFITGDLCPARGPLDRSFIETLKSIGPRTPVALSITGLWLRNHRADFLWLREQARSGALDITWVNHSFHHPWIPGRANESNFLLTPGVDMPQEILETEKLLIVNGETPSVLFRFPGLISDARLMDTVRGHNLVTLGADGWLVFAPPLNGGTIILIHPNGNENAGLRLFARQLEKGALPRPFRAINEAP